MLDSEESNEGVISNEESSAEEIKSDSSKGSKSSKNSVVEIKSDSIKSSFENIEPNSNVEELF